MIRTETLTRAMAIELGHLGITANCVAPGSILTEGRKKLFYGEDGKFRAAMEQLLGERMVDGHGQANAFHLRVSHRHFSLLSPLL